MVNQPPISTALERTQIENALMATRRRARGTSTGSGFQVRLAIRLAASRATALGLTQGPARIIRRYIQLIGRMPATGTRARRTRRSPGSQAPEAEDTLVVGNGREEGHQMGGLLRSGLTPGPRRPWGCVRSCGRLRWQTSGAERNDLGLGEPHWSIGVGANRDRPGAYRCTTRRVGGMAVSKHHGMEG